MPTVNDIALNFVEATGERVPASDPAARLVGKDAYIAAGGRIVRDPSDATVEYFADPALLNQLVGGMLQGFAEKVRAEGWKWVAVMRRVDEAAVGQWRRVHRRPAPLSDADQARVDELQYAIDVLLEEGDSDEREAALDDLEKDLYFIRGEGVFFPEDMARAGVIVTLAEDGHAWVERGFIRPEDDSP